MLIRLSKLDDRRDDDNGNGTGHVLGRPCRRATRWGGSPADRSWRDETEVRWGCKVPIQEARDGGHSSSGVRWSDVKQVDGTHRSQLVARGINMYNVPEVCAATMPKEPLRYLMFPVATLSSMHVDVARAYLYADAVWDVYMRLSA